AFDAMDTQADCMQQLSVGLPDRRRWTIRAQFRDRGIRSGAGHDPLRLPGWVCDVAGCSSREEPAGGAFGAMSDGAIDRDLDSKVHSVQGSWIDEQALGPKGSG